MVDYKALICHIENLDDEKTMSIIDDFISDEPTREEVLMIMNICQVGTKKVGILYEKGEYFISDLLVAGALLKEIKEKLQTVIEEDIGSIKSGRITLVSAKENENKQVEAILAKIIQMAGFNIIRSGTNIF
ncbi:B12-binding domain-containing protein [Eubacteriaceae bacterium ES2]|nr:B12-binding domain-containing protein [Eubacteriaceae bacterium ES2]